MIKYTNTIWIREILNLYFKFKNFVAILDRKNDLRFRDFSKFKGTKYDQLIKTLESN